MRNRFLGGLGQGFQSFGVRNYRIFWTGQVLSLVGTAMQSVSLPWLVLLLGGSPLELGIVGAAQYSPALVLAPIGGVIADRVDKRRLLIATQTVAMAEAVALFVLTVSGVVEIWHVVVLGLVIGVATAMEMPARSAFIAELLPRELLPNGIALNSVAFNGSRVIGPAIGGVTIAAFGVGANFGINAVSFGAVLLGLALLRTDAIRHLAPPELRPRILASLLEGVRYALRTPPVRWSLMLLLGVAVLAMQFTILIPLFARNVLELGPEGYGGLFAAYGAGSLAGAFALAFTGRRRFGLHALAACAVFLIAEAALSFTRDLVPAYAMTAACGFFSITFINTVNVTLQAHVTDALRGRVMALYVMVLVGSAPIGALFAGGVAQLWGSPAAFLLGAILGGVVLAVAAWRIRAFGGVRL